MADPLPFPEIKAYEKQGLDEYTARMAALADQTNRVYDRINHLQASLRDGTFAQHARHLAAVGREYDRLNRTARLTTLVAQHGRLGAVLRENREELTRLGRIAAVGYGAAFATVAGLTRAGFQGTVEGYRLAFAWERLSMQLAGVFAPAVDKFAAALDGLTERLRSLNGDQQDTLMNMGLLAAGAVTVGGAIWGLGKILGAVGAVGATAFRVLGLGAGAAGAAASGAAAAAGAGAGGAGAAAGGAAAAGAAMGLRGLGRLAMRVAGIGAAVNVGGEALTGGHYSRLRARGNNQFVSVLGALGGGVLDTLTLGAFGAHQREKDAAAAAAAATGSAAAANAPKPHRDVALMQTGFGEIGSSYFSIAEANLKATAATFQAGQNPEARAIGDKLGQILEWLANFGQKLGL